MGAGSQGSRPDEQTRASVSLASRPREVKGQRLQGNCPGLGTQRSPPTRIMTLLPGCGAGRLSNGDREGRGRGRRDPEPPLSPRLGLQDPHAPAHSLTAPARTLPGLQGLRPSPSPPPPRPRRTVDAPTSLIAPHLCLPGEPAGPESLCGTACSQLIGDGGTASQCPGSGRVLALGSLRRSGAGPLTACWGGGGAELFGVPHGLPTPPRTGLRPLIAHC